MAAQAMSQMLQFYFAQIDRDYYTISHTVSGLVTASFFITELSGSPILGALSDRLGRKKFIILGPVFGAIAVQLTAMTVAIWLLVVTRLLEGLSTASSIPATLGYISEATTGRPVLRARIIGLFEITFIGGIAAGAVLGGYLWKFFGKPATVVGLHLASPAFAMNGLIYVLSLAIFAMGLVEVVRGDDSAALSAAKPGQASVLASFGDASPRQPALQSLIDSVRQSFADQGKLGRYLSVLKSPPVLSFVPAWLAINSIIGMWINHSPRLLTGKDHSPHQLLMGAYGPVKFGNGYAALAVAFALGVLAWSSFIGQYRKTTVMLVATGGLFLTLTVLFSLNHGGIASVSAYYPLLSGLIAGLLIMSGFTPAALTYLADVTEGHVDDRGSIMGLYTVFLGLGQVVGTAIGGFFATWNGIDGLILLSGLFGFITIVTLIHLRSHEGVLLNRASSPIQPA
ncbi:MAG TPA: MFS transporter [Blastocatellia bacterium]|nr:MFS transporter [Blastocatellia bacterium]